MLAIFSMSKVANEGTMGGLPRPPVGSRKAVNKTTMGVAICTQETGHIYTGNRTQLKLLNSGAAAILPPPR